MFLYIKTNFMPLRSKLNFGIWFGLYSKKSESNTIKISPSVSDRAKFTPKSIVPDISVALEVGADLIAAEHCFGKKFW